MERVLIYTDGACKGNPGPGGWGASLHWGRCVKDIGGFVPNTTNNRMELTAVIKALEALNQPCEVELVTDSKYVVDAINNDWLNSWKDKGWRTAGKKPVANVDLWEELLALLNVHKVNFQWVKGHSGNPLNEKCDHIATNQIENNN